MRRTGTTRRSSFVVRTLVCGVLLRSLIAPGFMLDVGGSGPFGLQIVLCDGPAGTASLAAQNHRGPHGTTDVAGHEQHPEEHLSATCGMWMSSSVYVGDLAPDIDLRLEGKAHSSFVWRSATPIVQRPDNKARPRAPPASLSA